MTCHGNLPAIALNGHFSTRNELANLCDPDCIQSLGRLRDEQEWACAADGVDVDGEVHPVTETTETMLWTFNYTCRVDSSSGDFCAPVFDSWANGEADGAACSECVLGTFQFQLSYYLGYNEDHASAFASLTESCGETGYRVTSPASPSIGTPTTTGDAAPAPEKSCAGTYTVQKGDDCHAVSPSQNVSTSEMLYLNNLQGGCADFPGPGAELCMPRTCKVYTVEEGDTCRGIASAHRSAFSKSQLASWNVDIKPSCATLELLAGNQICVSPPGGAPVADKTTTHCARYHAAQPDDKCEDLALAYGIALDEFRFLNPGVGSTWRGLLPGRRYCVEPVGDISTYSGHYGSPEHPCVGGTAPGPPGCYATTYPTLPPWTFPAVPKDPWPSTFSHVDITPMEVETRRVVVNPTPTPFQEGMTAGCSWFYSVQGGFCRAEGWKGEEASANVLLVEDDTCDLIASRQEFSLETLYEWNPDLGPDCKRLYVPTPPSFTPRSIHRF